MLGRSLERDWGREQQYFEFGDQKVWPFDAPERVIMFSGGLDSLAGAGETTDRMPFYKQNKELKT